MSYSPNAKTVEPGATAVRRPKVAVRHGRDAYRTARAALESIGLPRCERCTVLLKPNAGRVAAAGSGIVTNAEVVAAAADCFREKGAARVLIGESPILGVKALDAFEAMGLGRVAKTTGATLVDLDAKRPVVVRVARGRAVRRIKVCADVLNADLVVSIPVMKTHMHTRVTLSIKNMKGALWRREKVRFHQLRETRRDRGSGKMLDVAISDLATVLLPDVALIDGTVGLEGMGPSAGTPKRTDLVVASRDALAADAVAARLMGIRPSSVPHLRLAAARGVGVIDLRQVPVDPSDYARYISRFAPPPKRLNMKFPGVVVHEGEACSACTSTLMLFLQQYQAHLADYALADGKAHLAIGKQAKPLPEGAIALGNCSAIVDGKRGRPQGIMVRGCPPVCSQVLAALGIAVEPKRRSRLE